MKYMISFETNEELQSDDYDDIFDFISQYGNNVKVEEVSEDE